MFVKCYIHAQWDRYGKRYLYTVFNGPMDEYGYTLIDTRDLEFTSPTDKELQVATVRALRAKQARILAEAHGKAIEIDEEIQEMLALPAPVTGDKNE